MKFQSGEIGQQNSGASTRLRLGASGFLSAKPQLNASGQLVGNFPNFREQLWHGIRTGNAEDQDVRLGAAGRDDNLICRKVWPEVDHSQAATGGKHGCGENAEFVFFARWRSEHQPHRRLLGRVKANEPAEKVAHQGGGQVLLRDAHFSRVPLLSYGAHQRQGYPVNYIARREHSRQTP